MPQEKVFFVSPTLQDEDKQIVVPLQGLLGVLNCGSQLPS